MKSQFLRMLFAGVISLVLGSVCAFAQQATTQQPASPAPSAVLVTKRMCCAHESVPAIKEMSKIPGVASVVADHKTRSLAIVAKGNAIPSPLAIWDAAERLKLEPVRLSTTLGVYNSKPRR